MSEASFVDLCEGDNLPVTRAPGQYQSDPGSCKELGISEEHDRAAYDRNTRIERGTASVEDTCEKELDVFCYLNVQDKNLVLEGEVWSDGHWHYFQADDFLAYLFQQHPDIKGERAYPFEPGLTRC